MRKIIIHTETSLDGVNQSPDFWGHVFKYHSDEVQNYLSKGVQEAGALLLGRMTYEAFAPVWSKRTGADAEKMNAMPKFVASRTLKGNLDWNAKLLKGDVVEAISELKKESGNELAQYGFGALSKTMIEAGLVDEVRLFVSPFTLGKGQRIFENCNITSLQLIDTRSFKTGVVLLRYRPINK